VDLADTRAHRANPRYLVLQRSLPLGSACLVCAFAALLSGCSAGDRPAGGANAEPAPLVEIARPDSVTAPSHEAGARFETALAPLHEVEIFARLDGEIVALDVEEGRRITAGQRLAEIDDRDRRATLAEREALVSRTESGWQRAQRLHDQSLISDEQWIAARSDWQVAQAQRDRARLDWERCAVRSPIAGVVEQRRVQIGQTVKQGDLLFRIGDPDTLHAELLLPESRLGTVRAGQRVRIEPSAGGAPRTARVTRVNPLVDAASGTFRVVIDLDNRAARLPAGVSARVAFDSLAAR
jgi:RND family efflux transporter MFP subunit